MKTMIVHDEGESDAGSTPCKDSTLIVRQVLAGNKTTKKQTSIICHMILFVLVYYIHLYPQCFSILFVCCVDHFLFLHLLQLSESTAVLN